MDYIKRFTTREGVRMSLAVTTDTVETYVMIYGLSQRLL